MKNDDSFGVELDLNITKFKNKIKQATTISTEFSKKIEKTRHFGQNAFGDIVEIKQVNNELIKQNRLYSEQQQMLNSITKLNRNKLALSNLGTANLMEGNNYSGYIASFKKATVEEKKEIKDLNNEIEKTGDISTRTGNEISNAFNKGLKSVKKLTIGFLGARTAFGLFRKYMNEYSRENEVFAQKMQLTSSVVANALAPAFEFFGNVIQYTVIGLARVVELLFGVNILGRTVDNSLKGASKSAKELNDNLSGLDEISNIDKDVGGLSTGIESQLQALDEFKKKIAEVDAWFKKYKIDEKILAIKNAVKSVWDWMSDHPIMTTAFVAGLIALKSNILPSLVNSLTGNGSTSLLGSLKLLLAVTITAWVADLVKDFNDLQSEVEEKTKYLEEKASKTESKGGEKSSYMKFFDEYDKKNYNEAMKYYNEAIDELEKAKKEQEKLHTVGGWIIDPVAYYDAEEEIEEIEWRIERIKNAQMKVNAEYDIANNQIGDSVNLTDNLTENLENAVKRVQFFNDTTSKSKTNISDTTDKVNVLNGMMTTGFNNVDYSIKNANNTFNTFDKNINNTFDKDYKLKIKTDDSDFETTKTKITSFFRNPITLKLNVSQSAGLGTIYKMFETMGIAFKNAGIPSYDVGTDYVPRDQLAMVHEGERIIPKKYNNSQYLGELGNSETNTLLMELNRNVLEFAKRPSVISVNGKELAKATYNDYQEESSRRGTNTSVRRV